MKRVFQMLALIVALTAGLVWLAVNFLFDRFLGMPRYRYDTVRARDLTVPGEPVPAGTQPEAAGREERRLRSVALGDLEPEHADVEAERALQVEDDQVGALADLEAADLVRDVLRQHGLVVRRVLERLVLGRR